jgi:hypothetical protein
MEIRMDYKIESIGAEFSDKAVASLLSQSSLIRSDTVAQGFHYTTYTAITLDEEGNSWIARESHHEVV